MQKELDTYLIEALKKLDKAYSEISKTQPFNKEAEKMKLLCELIKEQVKNEDTSSATR